MACDGPERQARERVLARQRAVGLEEHRPVHGERREHRQHDAAVEQGVFPAERRPRGQGGLGELLRAPPAGHEPGQETHLETAVGLVVGAHGLPQGVRRGVRARGRHGQVEIHGGAGAHEGRERLHDLHGQRVARGHRLVDHARDRERGHGVAPRPDAPRGAHSLAAVAHGAAPEAAPSCGRHWSGALQVRAQPTVQRVLQVFGVWNCSFRSSTV